jgi:hypothetical protein
MQSLAYCHWNGEGYEICASGNLTQGRDIVKAEGWA